MINVYLSHITTPEEYDQMTSYEKQTVLIGVKTIIKCLPFAHKYYLQRKWHRYKTENINHNCGEKE